MNFLFVSETKDINSPTRCANLFTLGFGKQPLFSKMVYVQDQPVNLMTYCAYCFPESMNVLDIKDECKEFKRINCFESVEVNC